MTKVTCILTVYNEAGRIRSALGGLVPWADEVLVCDKGSTDGTPALATAISANVRVVPIPYSERGCENHAELMRLSANDWIYFATCAEVPTRRLVEEIDRVLTERGTELDVVYVPRRMYSMGAHAPTSVWSVSLYPFLVHRDRVVTPGVLHDHFRATTPERQATISYRPDTCVHHYTHASIDAFVATHLYYAAHEAATGTPEEHFLRLREGLRALLPSLCHDRTVQVHGMGYAVYSLLVCLKRYEMDMGGPWQGVYAADAARVLEQEWQVSPNPSPGVRPTADLPLESRSRMTVCANLYRKGVVVFAYLLTWVARNGASKCRGKPGTRCVPSRSANESSRPH